MPKTILMMPDAVNPKAADIIYIIQGISIGRDRKVTLAKALAGLDDGSGAAAAIANLEIPRETAAQTADQHAEIMYYESNGATPPVHSAKYSSLSYLMGKLFSWISPDEDIGYPDYNANFPYSITRKDNSMPEPHWATPSGIVSAGFADPYLHWDTNYDPRTMSIVAEGNTCILTKTTGLNTAMTDTKTLAQVFRSARVFTPAAGVLDIGGWLGDVIVLLPAGTTADITCADALKAYGRVTLINMGAIGTANVPYIQVTFTGGSANIVLKSLWGYCDTYLVGMMASNAVVISSVPPVDSRADVSQTYLPNLVGAKRIDADAALLTLAFPNVTPVMGTDHPILNLQNGGVQVSAYTGFQLLPAPDGQSPGSVKGAANIQRMWAASKTDAAMPNRVGVHYGNRDSGDTPWGMTYLDQNTVDHFTWNCADNRGFGSPTVGFSWCWWLDASIAWSRDTGVVDWRTRYHNATRKGILDAFSVQFGNVDYTASAVFSFKIRVSVYGQFVVLSRPLRTFDSDVVTINCLVEIYDDPGVMCAGIFSGAPAARQILPGQALAVEIIPTAFTGTFNPRLAVINITTCRFSV